MLNDKISYTRLNKDQDSIHHGISVQKQTNQKPYVRQQSVM